MHAMMGISGREPSVVRGLRSTAETAARFQCWLGLSGRRHIVSVFRFDAGSPDRGLPDFNGCVVIPVCRDGEARSAIGAFPIEDYAEARAVRAAGIAAGIAEWHVHLLAEDRTSREAVVDDLRRRLSA